MGMKNFKKKLHDFVYGGKPHRERKLGELYEPKTASISTASGAA